MNTCPWRTGQGKDFKSTLRTAFIARPVISKTPLRTSTGSFLREGVALPIMECKVMMTHVLFRQVLDPPIVGGSILYITLLEKKENSSYCLQAQFYRGNM